MQGRRIAAFITLVLFSPVFTVAQEDVHIRGQFSSWININPGNELPVWMGARYIPQLNYGLSASKGSLIDLELSANINGSAGYAPFDSVFTEGNIKPYRGWLRYSSSRYELRLGLQKINFGSASMLRPLMWFDQMDPRDPLQLTDGVYGLLARYYLLNNANIWVWGLYGNRGPKTWEIGPTLRNTPEFGGRLQVPVPRGETAISFHHRKADFDEPPIQHFMKNSLISGTRLSGSDSQADSGPVSRAIAEDRIGFDGKWDLEIGLWLEAAWIRKREDVMMLTNQHIMTVGADYTFGLGNGLHIAVEHLLISMDQRPFEIDNDHYFTAALVSYPIGIFDNISGIVYYDWTGNNIYNFINWQRQFNRVTMYLMAFLNPDTLQLPQQTEAGQLFSGKGVQFMFVFNH